MTQIEYDEKLKALTQALDDVAWELAVTEGDLCADTNVIDIAEKLTKETNGTKVITITGKLATKSECAALLCMARQSIKTALFGISSARSMATNI